MDEFESVDAMDYIYERLKFTDLENEEIVVEVNSVAEVVNRGKNYLLLKLLTFKYYNQEAFKATMRRVCKQSLRFHNRGERDY